MKKIVLIFTIFSFIVLDAQVNTANSQKKPVTEQVSISSDSIKEEVLDV